MDGELWLGVCMSVQDGTRMAFFSYGEFVQLIIGSTPQADFLSMLSLLEDFLLVRLSRFCCNSCSRR